MIQFYYCVYINIYTIVNFWPYLADEADWSVSFFPTKGVLAKCMISLAGVSNLIQYLPHGDAPWTKMIPYGKEL